MKRLAVFILLLSNSFLFELNACGFYPWGEEVRFCYLKPRYFNYDQGYSYFNYTSDWYDYESYTDDPDGDYNYSYYAGANYYEPNVALWQQYCNGKVPFKAIEEAVYKLPAKDINSKSKNTMIKHLYSKNDKDAIDYLLFAKQCEKYTWEDSDPWEKNDSKALKPAIVLIKIAGKKAEEVKDSQLKKRYLFLKTRLSFYSGKTEEITDVYNTYFKNEKQKDLLYYWVLFFYTQLQSDPVVQNYYAAQVFANAPDKRFVARSNYDRSIPIEETLKLVKTPQEKANIWLLHGVRITDKGLPYLKNIYKNNPSAHGLGFMLLREINKMEDWILTPQYSLFEPSTRADYWENNNAQRIFARVKTDRQYAREVLDFINSVDFSKTDNPELWYLAKAYVAFMAQDNNTSVEALNVAEKAIGKTNTLYAPLQLVKGMVLIAAQKQGNAQIPKEAEAILMEQYKQGNYKYIFGLGRELEEKGNTTLAALLYSKIKNDDYDNWNDIVHWKAKNNITSMYSDYYWEYLAYIDACYTIPEVKAFIADVKKVKKKNTLDTWLYAGTLNSEHEFYRILGTKYLRENKLAEARDAFKNISPKTDYIFEENPFYKIKGTPEFTNKYDKKQKVNRVYIMDNLIKLLEKANNPAQKDRDLFYFEAANCYYNMSFNGNAWNMRRRFMSTSQTKTNLPDDDDFFGNKTAFIYYKLAYKYAKTDKFKALCLRMMAQCEKSNIYYAYDQNWQINYNYDLKPGANKYDGQLKKQYGTYYDELTSNCTAFSDYFKARR